MVKQAIKRAALALLMCAFVLCLVLGIGLLLTKTQSAYAAEYVGVDGTLADTGDTTVTSVTSSTTAWSDGWYIVDSDVTISSRINVSGDVNLILADGFTLNADAGITVFMTDTLTIYAQTAGTGTLNATGSDGTANDGASAGIGGIGGEYAHIGYDCGTVIIRGGIINATGGSSRSTGAGAGIGGGGAGHYYEPPYVDVDVMRSLSGGDCVSVIITGGTVRAYGGSSILNMGGDGIGGGGAKTGFNGTYEPGDKGTLNSFSTAGGSAVIYAVGGGGESSSANGVAIGSIDDGEPWNSDSWSGIIFQGNSGQVYGDQTLTGNFTVESGQTLTVPSGTTLTVPAGTTLTNNGAITNNGTINVYGTFAGNSVSGNEVNIILHTCESIENGVIDAVALSSAGGTLNDGNYYLPANITLEENITINGDVTLCLNGHVLTGNGSGSVITVNSGVKFTLCDCHYNDEAVSNVVSDTTYHSGVITGGNSIEGGGVHVSSGATFIMEGATIAYNSAKSNEESTSVYGGGVYVSGTFIMIDGNISNNKAIQSYSSSSYSYGGGVCVNNGLFKMTGGIIAGNIASVTGENSVSFGGGVYMCEGTFIMTGGTIAGNIATASGEMNEGICNGAYLDWGSNITISGGNIGDKIYRTVSVTVSIVGGYFADASLCKDNGSFDFSVAEGYQVVQIAPTGSDYPYAVYASGSTTYSISAVNIVYGSSYTPQISGNSHGADVSYSYSLGGVTKSGLPSAVGQHTVTATFAETVVTNEDGSKTYYPSGSATFTVTIAPEITTPYLPSATYGTVYSQTLQISSGDTATWSITSGMLPYGLSLNGSTGEISGTPELVAGYYTFTVSATVNGISTEREFAIIVDRANQSAPDENEGYIIDYSDETITAKSGYELATSETALSGSLSLNLTPGTNVYVRVAETATHTSSPWTEVTVPARPSFPAPSINFKDETIATATDMEYRIGDNGAWTSCNEDMRLSSFGWYGTDDVIVYFRSMAVTTSDYGQFASAAAKVTIPARPAPPSFSIDNEAEGVTIPGAYYYNFTSAYYGNTWMPGTGALVPVEPGATIYIYAAETDSAFKSTVLTLTAPQRADTPNVPSIDFDKEIISTTVGMEYSVGESGSWMACMANMTAEAFGWTGEPGVTVQFRTAATDSYYASEATAAIEIPARPKAPSSVEGSYTVSTVDGTKFVYTITPINGAEYSKDGTNWQPSNVFDGITPESTVTFYVRIAATESSFASEADSIDVTFSKFAGSGSVEIAGWTYGETANMPVPTSETNGTSSVTYLYESTDGAGYSSEQAPTNAGSYRVTATFEATAVYTEATAYYDFTIAKATLTVTAVNKEVTYGDVVPTYTLTYSGWQYGEGESVLTTKPTADSTYTSSTGVGTVEITVSGGAADNYNFNYINGKLTVKAKSISGATVTLGTSLTYNGQPQEQTITSVVIDGLNVTYGVSGNVQTDADDYTLTITGNGNFTGTVDVSWSIAKRALTTDMFSVTGNYEYDGSEQKATYDFFDADGELVAADFGVTYSNNVNAGNSAAITFTATDSGNYSGAVSLNFTIAKATYDMSGVSFNDATYTYDGSEKTLVITGTLPAGVTVSYSGNAQINVGTYTVTAAFTGNANYNTIPSMSATLTINKATYDMSGISFGNASYTYDGSEKTLVITGELPNGVTVTYTTNTLTNAGSIEVTASFTGDTSNYNAIADMTATLTIEKATYDMSGISLTDATFTYDGGEKTIVITGTLPNGVAVTYTNNVQTNAGTYIVTASFTGDANNYNAIADMTATLTIEKAIPEYTIPDELTAIAGQTLDEIELPDGWSWVEGSLPLNEEGEYTMTAIYTPEDTENYDVVTVEVVVTVEQATDNTIHYIIWGCIAGIALVGAVIGCIIVVCVKKHRAKTGK